MGSGGWSLIVQGSGTARGGLAREAAMGLTYWQCGAVAGCRNARGRLETFELLREAELCGAEF
jgi:hypothetical protein